MTRGSRDRGSAARQVVGQLITARSLVFAIVPAIALACLLAVTLAVPSSGAASAPDVAPVFAVASGQLVDPSGLRCPPEATVSAQSLSPDQSLLAATGRLAVKFSAFGSAECRAQLFAELGLREVSAVPQIRVSVVQLAGPESGDYGAKGLELVDLIQLSGAATALARRDDVVWVQDDSLSALALTPNDPAYPNQWGLPAIGLPAAWDMTTGSPSVTVAIVDTGLALLEDFAGRVVNPYSTKHRSSSQFYWNDTVGHGTALAGILAAKGNNAIGMTGSAWNVNIMPVHISDSSASYDSDGAAGIIYAVDHGADVINFSSGSDQPSYVLADAIDYAQSHGVVVVAAAGNSGYGSGIMYPAALQGVIAVGATRSTGSRASFSSTGLELDIVAPGEQVATYRYLDNSYWGVGYTDGTSFSAPAVAGVVALMLAREPSLSAAEVESILANTADDRGDSGWDPEYGDGQVNARKAVESAGDHAAPSIRFSRVPSGVLTKGQVTFALSVSDNLGVCRVEQYLDGSISYTTMPRVPHYYDESAGGKLYVQDMSLPIEGSLDTTQLPDGSTHTIGARAYDAAGNLSTAQITFTVDNREPTTTTTTPPATQQFGDVSSRHPYFVQISDLTSSGIVAGFAGGIFKPDQAVTRQQFAKMIVKTMGYPVSEADVCPFIDVPSNIDPNDSNYPDQYVAVCAAHGITVGTTSTSFDPYGNITRAQLITMVTRAVNTAEPPGDYNPPFRQFDTTHYPFARRAAYAGFLSGLQGLGLSYDLLTQATRGEVCLVLYNLLHRNL